MIHVDSTRWFAWHPVLCSQTHCDGTETHHWRWLVSVWRWRNPRTEKYEYEL